MEWPSVVYAVGVGVGVVLIAVALIVFVVASLPLLGDMRRLVADARRLSALTETELRPTLAELRQLTATLNEVSGELRPRLERIDALAAEAEATLGSVGRAADALSRYADLPAAGIASVTAGLRRAGGLFGRGRASHGPVESAGEMEDSR